MTRASFPRSEQQAGIDDLNYNIRILRRRGVLVPNADFLPGKDRAAAYGLTGLIVGAAAAKAGFFKGLWAALLAFKRFLIVGLAALGAALKRFFTRKREEPPSTEQAT